MILLFNIIVKEKMWKKSEVMIIDTKLLCIINDIVCENDIDVWRNGRQYCRIIIRIDILILILCVWWLLFIIVIIDDVAKRKDQ